MGVRIVRQVVEIVEELSNYLPLTLRQIHYQLVARNVPGYENTQNKYKQLSGWLYDARVDGLISWDVMVDRGRGFSDLSGFYSSKGYLTAYLKHIRGNYRRNLLQGQSMRIEVWTEKDALASVIERFASPYTVSVQPCRGFGSGSQFDEVVKRNGDKPLKVLYFGDHDPSGLWMSDRDICRRLSEKHGIYVQLDRVALNHDQVEEYNLAADWQIPKSSDSRARWYIGNFGERCWELDALRPDILGELVTRAIESNIDMDMFTEEQRQEKEDLSEIETIVDGWTEDLGA